MTNLLDRRKLIFGGFGALTCSIFPQTVFASKAATVFSLLWGGIEVGYSKIELSKKGSTTIANIEVDIAVKILNFDAFSYKLQNKETWSGNSLLKIASETKIGKKTDYVKGKSTKTGFEIDGSGFSGKIEGNPATTSYFSPEFLKRKIWISTQNGDPLNIIATKIGVDKAKTKDGYLPANLWRITGDIELDLLYGADGQWLGSRFKAGGAQAEFELKNKTGNMDVLWKS